MNELTCFECGYVGDHHTHFNTPTEPGYGVCKVRADCVKRKASLIAKRTAENPHPPDAPKLTRDELHKRDS